MKPLKMWLHSTQGCNHQSTACPNYSLDVQQLWYSNLWPWSQRWRLRSALRQGASGSSVLPQTQTRASRAKGESLIAIPPLSLKILLNKLSCIISCLPKYKISGLFWIIHFNWKKIYLGKIYYIYIYINKYKFDTCKSIENLKSPIEMADNDPGLLSPNDSNFDVFLSIEYENLEIWKDIQWQHSQILIDYNQ